MIDYMLILLNKDKPSPHQDPLTIACILFRSIHALGLVMTCLRLTTTQSADIGLIAKGLVSLWLLDLGTGWKFDVSTIHGSVCFRGTFLSVSVDASQLLESSQKQYISIGFFLGWILIFVAICLSKSLILLILQKPVALQPPFVKAMEWQNLLRVSWCTRHAKGWVKSQPPLDWEDEDATFLRGDLFFEFFLSV